MLKAFRDNAGRNEPWGWPAASAARSLFAAFVIFSLLMSFGGTSAHASLKGVGGLEAEPPAPVELGNMLVNPGFEEGATGWRLGRCFSVDNTVAYSGSSSMRLDWTGKCGSARQLGVRFGAEGYTIRGWIKTENVVKGVPRITAFDSTHGGYAGATIVGPKGTNDWKFFEIADTDILSGHHDDTMELRLYPAGVTGGRVWFDDIEFVPTAPVLRVFVRYPNFRGYLWDDGNQTVRADIEVNAPGETAPGDYTAEVVVLDAGTMSVVETVSMTGLQEKNTFIWAAGAMASGSEALLRVMLKNAGGDTVASYPDFRIVKKSAQFREGLNNWIDGDNRLIHGGERRFVWGVYDRMSGYRCKGCIGATREYYESIAGFNGLSTLDNYRDTKANTVIYFSPFSGANPGVPHKANDQINPWAEALRSRGAMHLQIVNNYYDTSKYRPGWARSMSEEEMWEAIGTKITDPGFLGYYAADEPDLFRAPSLSDVFRQYGVLKAANPGSVTLEVFAGAASVKRWRESADVMGFDVYPVGPGPLPDDRLADDWTPPFFARVDLWTDEAVKAVEDSRPVWVVHQLWSQGGRFPVYEDMRKAAWKSIISGAKGILWWGFVSSSGLEARWYGPYQSGTVPPYDPAAYPDYKRISGEVMALESVLLSEDQAGVVECADARIRFIVKRDTDFYYVMATNLREEPLRGVVFTVGHGLEDGVEVYAESRAIVPDGAAWTDDFEGYGVHVYRIELNRRRIK